MAFIMSIHCFGNRKIRVRRMADRAPDQAAGFGFSLQRPRFSSRPFPVEFMTEVMGQLYLRVLLSYPVSISSLSSPVSISSLSYPVSIISLPSPVSISSLPSPVSISSLPSPVSISSLSSPVSIRSLLLHTHFQVSPMLQNFSNGQRR